MNNDYVYFKTRVWLAMTAVMIKNKLNIVTSELPQHEMVVNIFLSNMTENIIKCEV
jgi:flagellar biosynthesis regulator FlaF